MYERILVANDGSPAGYLALNAAFDLANRYGAELHMIIIEEIEPSVSAMEVPVVLTDVMNKHCKEVIANSEKMAAEKGIKMETHHLLGFPIAEITGFTKVYNFDLLVVGFMEHGAFYRWLVGSTTDGLVGYVPCSVLVVKARSADAAEQPVDGSTAGDEHAQAEGSEGIGSDRDTEKEKKVNTAEPD